MIPCNKVFTVKDINTGEILYCVDTNKTLIMEVIEHEQY